MDTRLVSGFIIGFALATLLIFGYIQVQLGPSQAAFEKIKPYADSAYDMASSEKYAELEADVDKVGAAALEFSKLPVVGGMVDAEKITKYSATVRTMMENAKMMSIGFKNTVDSLLFLINMANAAVIGSVVALLVGIYLLVYPGMGKKAPAKAGKGRKR